MRDPQREGWVAIREHYDLEPEDREIGVVLPVGCGKSGLIAVTPFATRAERILVTAPNLRIRDQLANDFSSANPSNFYERFGIVGDEVVLPEVAVVEREAANLDDIQHAQVVVANIQQLQGEDNRWLMALPEDFFDLILVDEAHHNTAESWDRVRNHFPAAQIVNYSATPRRADGGSMHGRIVYSYPVARAIEAGYVKRLRAKMLNPAQLLYVDPSDGVERLISADEVRWLGGEEARFRRGILMSEQTLGSIVQCSIDELRRLREETGNQNLKIIASALHQSHCIQIVQAFRERRLCADYVHSNEGQEANQRVFRQLENHELDVIVQARMLGEGFDHPELAVAMVGSIFSNLSPFVQFVGRVMRSLTSGEPDHPLNRGVVVFHAGANVAERWDDFREFSEADQEYFQDLLPLEEDVDFDGRDTVEREPGLGRGPVAPVEVIEEQQVRVEDLPLLDDPRVEEALNILGERGVTPEQAANLLRRRQPQRQDRRRALRASLPERAANAVGQIMARQSLNRRGRTLDPARRQNDFEFLVSNLNRRLGELVGRGIGERQDFTLEELERCHAALESIVAEIEAEFFDGST